MKEDIVEYLQEQHPEIYTDILLADGFEEAFMGVSYSFGSAPKACYDTRKCIDILQKRDGMTLDEAVEYFDYNVTGAYVGDFTPSFMVPFQDQEISEGDADENDYLG